MPHPELVNALGTICIVPQVRVSEATESVVTRLVPGPFGSDDVLDAGVELIQYAAGVVGGWDTDADDQWSQLPAWYFDDQERREWTDFIVLPFNIWDTDADHQRANPLPFGTDDVLDAGVELVQYGAASTNSSATTTGSVESRQKTAHSKLREDRAVDNSRFGGLLR
jgi:hypothetical protein